MAKNKQQIKIEGDITGLKKAMQEGVSSVTSLNKVLKLNQAELKGTNNNVNTLKDRLKVLTDAYDKQKQVVADNEEAYKKSIELYGENSKEAKSLANQLTDNKTKLQKLKNEIDETNKKIEEQTNKFITNGKKLEETGEKWQKLGDKMNKVGNVVSVVGAGVAGALVATTKAAIDYESAFTGVEKTVDGTAEQLQALSDGILEMSTRMPVAATEIAGVAESAGQLGIERDNVLSFTEVMINLGEATNLSADEAASSLAKFANITNMSANDYERLGSVIVDLGNNFATTEADIVGMATRLAATGELTGLSQSQIMALATAMSSVGIEAEAGGSAMSKLLKKIQVACETGGKDLKQFAKVSGKSTKEFKDAFQKDAVGALSLFLTGLQDTKRNGKSAIAILDDMDLKEVRLSNTILSLSNANGVLSKAVTTANDAWNENTALQTEVDKRYGTTESQMKMLKNEATKLGIEFGNELVPSLRTLLKDAKPLLNTVSDAIKKFSNLDDKTKQNTIKILALTAAIGPLIKTGGSLISCVGKTTTAIGKMVEKIGESKKASDNLTGQTSKLKTAFSAVGTAITGVVAAYAAYKVVDEYYKQKAEDQVESINKVTYAIKSSNDAWLENRKTQEESVNGNLAELNHLQSLKDQLDELVDANGRVQEKDKSRAQYIMNELNTALGTELKLNGDIIESYDSIKDGINETIEAKKREILMNAFEDKLSEAIQNKTKSYNEWQQSIQSTTEAEEKLNNVRKEVDKEFSGWKRLLIGAGNLYISISNKTKEYTTALEESKKAQEDAKNKYEQNVNDMLTASEALANGEKKTYEELEILWRESFSTHNSATNSQVQNLVDTLPQVIDELNKYKDAYEKNSTDTALYLQQQQQSTLDNMVATLVAETKATKELTPELQKAWKLLGEGSATDFNTAINQVEPDTRKEIQSIVGILQNDTTVKDAVEDLGEKCIEAFNSNDFEQSGSNAATDIKTGIENKKSTFSNLGFVLGSSLMSGITSYIGKNSGAVTGLVSAIKGSHADGLAYVPYNGYVARLHEGERVLTKRENADYVRNNINNNNSSTIVNFYSQQITEAEIDRVSRYINRKWGDRA